MTEVERICLAALDRPAAERAAIRSIVGTIAASSFHAATAPE